MHVYFFIKEETLALEFNEANDLTDEYDIITCEKLNTKKMIMAKTLSKSIIDAGFSEILRQLSYKARYKHKYFYQIDTYYPSSQKCTYCGSIDRKYKDIGKRIYKCHKCGSIIDRDINASLNIQYEGLVLYMKELCKM